MVVFIAIVDVGEASKDGIKAVPARIQVTTNESPAPAELTSSMAGFLALPEDMAGLLLLLEAMAGLLARRPRTASRL